MSETHLLYVLCIHHFFLDDLDVFPAFTWLDFPT